MPPTIFTDVPATSSLFREEIFGPVLSITKAKTFDDALTLANDCAFALTGGLYSRSPVNIERAKAEWVCGNLYINRGITGAIVGRQPFASFKMGGGGTKAGGREYGLPRPARDHGELFAAGICAGGRVGQRVPRVSSFNRFPSTGGYRRRRGWWLRRCRRRGELEPVCLEGREISLIHGRYLRVRQDGCCGDQAVET